MPDTSIFTSVINSYLPEPHASLLNGMLFGIPLKGYKIFNQQLKTVGLIHIVVLSGSNITLLTAIITQLTIRFGRKISIFLSIGTIIAFIQFVGPQPPIVRAGCMGVLSLLAILYGRKTITVWLMLLSALFIWIFWPQWITGISFQLSYAATLGLVLFSRKLDGLIKKNDNNLGAYIKDELKTSLSAQIFTVPLIFFYFREISFISPVSNVLIAWTIAPIMVFGLLTAVLGNIHTLLGLIPSYICYTLLSYIIFIVETLSKIPFAAIKF